MEEVKKKRHRRTKVEMAAVRAKEAPRLLPPAAQKELREDIGKKVTEIIDEDIINQLNGLPANPDIEPVGVLPVKKSPKLVRDLEEKVEFLLEDMKSLRAYMCRFEDAFAEAKIAIPEKPELVTTKKYKTKRRNP
jgi:hypothetical protein